MSLKIDRKLNMVLPVVNDDGRTVYAFSTPISREVFETNFEVLSRTFTQIYTGGHGIYAGPRIAKLLLRKVAEGSGIWEGQSGVKNNLVAEITRLTNVLAPAERGGWDIVPFDDAVQTGVLSEEDAAEIENAVVFFIVASAIHRKAELRSILEASLNLWGARPEYLSLTAFRDSLPTSTGVGNTGEKATPSSIPV